MSKFKLWMKRLFLYGVVTPIALLLISCIVWIVFVWARNMHTASIPKSEFKEFSVEEIEDLIFPGDTTMEKWNNMSYEERKNHELYSDKIDFKGAKDKLKGKYFCLSGNAFMLVPKFKLVVLISDKFFEFYRCAFVVCHMSDRSDLEKLESGPWLARVNVYGKCTSMSLHETFKASIVHIYGVSVDQRDQHQYLEYTAKELLKLKQKKQKLAVRIFSFSEKCKLENKAKLEKLKKLSSEENKDPEELYDEDEEDSEEYSEEEKLTPAQEKELSKRKIAFLEFSTKHFWAPKYLKITGTITDIKSIDEQGSIYDRKLIMQCKGTEYEDSIKNVLTPKLEFTVWPLLKKVNCFAHVYEEFYRKKVGDTVTIYVNLNNMSDANDSYDIMYFEEVSPEQKALAEKEAKYPEPAKGK